MIHVLTKLVENVHGHIYNELKKINLTKKKYDNNGMSHNRNV